MALALAGGLTALYLRAPTVLLTWDPLNVGYALRHEDWATAFHFGHPLANALQVVAWWCARGSGAMPLEVLAWLSAAASGLAVALLYVAVRAQAGPLPSASVALLVGVLFSPWAYATAPEVYPLVAVALCGLCAAWMWAGERWAVGLGALAGLLVASHLLAGLVVLGLAADAALGRRWRFLGVFLGTAAATFALATLAAGALLGATPAMVAQRVREHVAANPPGMATLGAEGLVRRLSLLVFGGVDPSAELIPLAQQSTLPRGLLVGLALVGLVAAGLRDGRTRGPALGALVFLAGLLALDPGSEALYLALPLAALPLARRLPGRSWLLCLPLIAILASKNLQATTVAARPEVNPRFVNAQALAACLQPDDALVVRPGIETMYLRYFVPGDTIFVDPAWPVWVQVARERMAAATTLYAPGSLWVFDDGWLEDPDALAPLLEGWERVEAPCAEGVELYRLRATPRPTGSAGAPSSGSADGG